MAVMLDLLAVALILWFTMTQVLIPAIKGTRPFPMFGRRRALEEELQRLRTEVEAERLREQAEREQERLDAMKRKPTQEEGKEDGDGIQGDEPGHDDGKPGGGIRFV